MCNFLLPIPAFSDVYLNLNLFIEFKPQLLKTKVSNYYKIQKWNNMHDTNMA